MLASMLGRTQVVTRSPETTKQIISATDEVIAILENKTKPLVPHTDKSLIHQIGIFTEKLHRMLNSDRVKQVLPSIQQARIAELLNLFNTEVNLLGKGKYEQLILPSEIEEMFQFYGIWNSGWDELKHDLSRWQQIEHPDTPNSLRQPITQDETVRLIDIMKREVLKIDVPLMASIYLTSEPENYHLFWAITAEGSDYVTPRSYGLDTQLSFDLPHNVAHLIHLQQLKDLGVYGYVDDMPTRAFFEAIAVFAELEVVRKLEKDSAFAHNMVESLDESRDISGEELGEWMIEDRSFEFRLRASRLMADLLAIDGATLPEIVEIVSTSVNIPREVAQAEVSKYYPWTGLGAIYTLGYRKLEQAGILGIREVLTEQPPTTWGQFTNNSLR
jgi:hypothetical protein